LHPLLNPPRFAPEPTSSANLEMKNTLSLIGHLLCIACAGVLFSAHAASASDSLKLLTIGNSFSNDATAFLPDMAKAGGNTLLVGKAAIGGCSLERHARHLRQAEAGDPTGRAYNTTDPVTGEKRWMTLPELLSAQPWDVVTLQQWSRLSFKPETFQPYADELIVAIRRYAPTAEIVVHETWAYRDDHAFFQQSDGFTPAKMYAGLSAGYRSFAADKGFRLLPVGDAFDLARGAARWTYTPDPAFDFKNPPADRLPDQHGSLNVGWRWIKDKEGRPVFSLDAIHCNDAGKYLGAAVWYVTLFKTDSVPANYTPEKLSPTDAADLRIHAMAAVKAQRAREISLSAQ
jgi:hypothetical protein